MPDTRISGLQAARAFEVALEALKADRVRTRSAIVALTIAMAIVVCLSTLVERGRASTIRALEHAGLTNLYLVNRSAATGPGVAANRLSVADLERLAVVFGVDGTLAVRTARRDIVSRGTPFSAPVYAVSGDLSRVLGVRSGEGRLLGDLDVGRKSPYCVIGADVPRVAKLAQPAGSVVNAGSRGYEVVGVLAATSMETTSVGEIPSIEWNRALVVPLGTEPDPVAVADDRYPIDFAVLHFDTARQAEAAAAALARSRSRSGDQVGYLVTSPLQTLRQYKASRRTFDRLIWLVCLLTAASAVFGISNQMSASVIARTREIGVRRAVGARGIDIVFQFQAEGILLGVLGGGLGLMVGVLVSLLTVERSSGGLSLSLASFGMLAGGCILIGIITGIRPASRAARIDPAVALREG